MEQYTEAGMLALLGSGEYLDVMNEVDTYLLEARGGTVQESRVALLPTASGLEANGPNYWNGLGSSHFRRLGVKEVRATRILDHQSANDPEQVALLEESNLTYFSGGDPQHVIESMRDSAAWRRIETAYRGGMSLAGCSAGAMAMGGFTLAIRDIRAGQEPRWASALGLVPHIVVFPHFDRMRHWMGEELQKMIIASAPAGCVLVGIDENTALLRTYEPRDDRPATWRVMGQQSVTLFSANAEPRAFQVGAEIEL